MKVQNFTSTNGRAIPNQFIIAEDDEKISGNPILYFQSHQSIIAKIDKFRVGIAKRKVWLDINN